MRSIYLIVAATAFSACALAQSPAATASLTVGGKALEIKYNSPRVNGREGKLFGVGGRISTDPNYTNGSETGTLTITPRAPTVTISGGRFTYDGTVRSARLWLGVSEIKPSWSLLGDQ